MYSPHALYCTTVQYNNLHETSYVPDDDPVWSKLAVEYMKVRTKRWFKK
jgi:hypothetical protein